MAPVELRDEVVNFPTYAVGEPDRNPMFLHKRVYQGSSGRVYPYPVIDSVADEPRDVQHRALTLENEYLSIMVLPGLGGRIHRALDKTNHHDFIYFNRVIKPALVGLAGPWISGGIEFNWPQHHRPNTFGPVLTAVERHDDGAITLWCGETDRMHGTRGMHGLTLRPGRAVLEITGRCINPTPFPQTFLWWANPAVAVNDHYQSVFPPDVVAVLDHGKRAVSSFPIATGEYYKVDYSPGTDISWYRNIPVPTSYMAARSDFDFVGGYDHGRRAGVLHVADHHVSPGKKQWTWGCGDFGKSWDRHLTDEDGPYIELMTGVYTDNQPDFSWLLPAEEKRFRQAFLPYKDIGLVKNASLDAAVSLSVRDGKADVGAYATSRVDVDVVLRNEKTGEVLLQERRSLSPEAGILLQVSVGDAQERDLSLSVVRARRELVDYSPGRIREHPIPTPASPAPKPADVPGTEDLLLWGTHLEQYRHATRDPEPYYREALRREPEDLRANNALGLLLLRRGQLDDAEPLLRRAVEAAQRRNGNPRDSEPLFNLGTCRALQGDRREAIDLFGKAAWTLAQRDASWLAQARLECADARLLRAADILSGALEASPRLPGAWPLLAALLRRMGQLDDAARILAEGRRREPLDLMLRVEEALLERARGNEASAAKLLAALVDFIAPDLEHYALEVAREYRSAGLEDEAREVLVLAVERARASGAVPRLLLDYLGDDAAAGAFSDRCFPNRLEDLQVLRATIARNPADGAAHRVLGNLLYDKNRAEQAIAHWERALELDPSDAVAARNLGIALHNVRRETAAALARLELAASLAPQDARLLFEWDQVARLAGEPVATRLARLEARAELLEKRDDLVLEHATLLNLAGRHEEALARITSRRFHPWEGGEGKVSGQYVTALVELARAALAAGKKQQALALLDRALAWPESLGEGKLAGARENDVQFLRALALGGGPEATAALEAAASGDSSPAPAWFYNDQPPEKLYYQGSALRCLGREGEARALFDKLRAYGEEHLDDQPEIDFFAVSLPDFTVFEGDFARRNRVHCLLMIGLARLAEGDFAGATAALDEALALDPACTPAALHRRLAADGRMA